ncbi:MAG: class I SAM-dependent RNA methyltransferase, partial [Solirubrobacteraceae bacterium]|nr:class I SAM-dependent RNA methyltransferase [Solirubrobacteraceae bacterium]
MTEQPTVEGERTRIDRGDRLEVRIEGLANGGKGIARVALGERSYVIFVRDTVPGDLVRIEVTKRKRAFAEARPLEMLEPGPDRIEPLADHPGAAWQVLSYERQLEVKSEQVDDALRRIGKLDGFELEAIIPAVEEWRYRNKLEFSFGVEEDGTLCCGFHAPGSWSRILPMDDCLLASEASNRIREAALEVCQEMGLKAYDRRTHEGLLRNLVVREGRRTGQIQARIVTSPGDFDQRRFADAMIEAGAISVIRTVAPSSGETT